jgi:chromosome partition protein MukB
VLEQVCQLPDLNADNMPNSGLKPSSAREQEATEALLMQLEQKMNVAECCAFGQFENAYQLVVKIVGEVSRSEAWQAARVNYYVTGHHNNTNAERVQPLRMRLS